MEQAIMDKDFGTFAELTMKASILCLQALCIEFLKFSQGRLYVGILMMCQRLECQY